MARLSDFLTEKQIAEAVVARLQNWPLMSAWGKETIVFNKSKGAKHWHRMYAPLAQGGSRPPKVTNEAEWDQYLYFALFTCLEDNHDD